MSEVKKINEELLIKLQRLVSAKAEFSDKVLSLEMSAFEAKGILSKVEASLNQEQEALKEEYGNVDIDLKTGEVTERKEQEEA